MFAATNIKLPMFNQKCNYKNNCDNSNIVSLGLCYNIKISLFLLALFFVLGKRFFLPVN